MGTVTTFFADRWARRVGWTTLFWRDLLLVGTLFNALCTLTALAMLSQRAPVGGVLAVHLLPLPYGLFIVSALWRAPNSPAIVRALSLAWLAIGVLI
jgi:hypothetical protein